MYIKLIINTYVINITIYIATYLHIYILAHIFHTYLLRTHSIPGMLPGKEIQYEQDKHGNCPQRFFPVQGVSLISPLSPLAGFTNQQRQSCP